MTTSTLQAAKAAIETRLQSQWVAAGYPAAAIDWGNTNFLPPSGITSLWVQPFIMWGSAARQTMGAIGAPGGAKGRNEVVGVLVCNLFARPGMGRGPVTTAGDVMRDCFQRQDIAGVRFGAASGPKPVTTTDKSWDQVALSIPFTWEEAGA